MKSPPKSMQPTTRQRRMLEALARGEEIRVTLMYEGIARYAIGPKGWAPTRAHRASVMAMRDRGWIAYNDTGALMHITDAGRAILAEVML